MQKSSSGRTAHLTNSSTSSLGTEFTCLAYMYVTNYHHHLDWGEAWYLGVSVPHHFHFYRCTIKWIRSPSRRWTAWLADLTVSSSGQRSLWSWLSTAVILLSCTQDSSAASCFLSMHISCGMKLNLDYLLETLWEYLALICIYTKKRGGTACFPSWAPFHCHIHRNMFFFLVMLFFPPFQSAQTLTTPSLWEEARV